MLHICTGRLGHHQPTLRRICVCVSSAVHMEDYAIGWWHNHKMLAQASGRKVTHDATMESCMRAWGQVGARRCVLPLTVIDGPHQFRLPKRCWAVGICEHELGATRPDDVATACSRSMQVSGSQAEQGLQRFSGLHLGGLRAATCEGAVPPQWHPDPHG